MAARSNGTGVSMILVFSVIGRCMDSSSIQDAYNNTSQSEFYPQNVQYLQPEIAAQNAAQRYDEYTTGIAAEYTNGSIRQQSYNIVHDVDMSNLELQDVENNNKTIETEGSAQSNQSFCSQGYREPFAQPGTTELMDVTETASIESPLLQYVDNEQTTLDLFQEFNYPRYSSNEDLRFYMLNIYPEFPGLELGDTRDDLEVDDLKDLMVNFYGIPANPEDVKKLVKKCYWTGKNLLSDRVPTMKKVTKASYFKVKPRYQRIMKGKMIFTAFIEKYFPEYFSCKQSTVNTYCDPFIIDILNIQKADDLTVAQLREILRNFRTFFETKGEAESNDDTLFVPTLYVSLLRIFKAVHYQEVFPTDWKILLWDELLELGNKMFVKVFSQVCNVFPEVGSNMDLILKDRYLTVSERLESMIAISHANPKRTLIRFPKQTDAQKSTICVVNFVNTFKVLSVFTTTLSRVFAFVQNLQGKSKIIFCISNYANQYMKDNKIVASRFLHLGNERDKKNFSLKLLRYVYGDEYVFPILVKNCLEDTIYEYVFQWYTGSEYCGKQKIEKELLFTKPVIKLFIATSNRNVIRRLNRDAKTFKEKSKEHPTHSFDQKAHKSELDRFKKSIKRENLFYFCFRKL